MPNQCKSSSANNTQSNYDKDTSQIAGETANTAEEHQFISHYAFITVLGKERGTKPCIDDHIKVDFTI